MEAFGIVVSCNAMPRSKRKGFVVEDNSVKEVRLPGGGLAASASQGCGVRMSADYWQVVQEMRRASMAGPGRVRPSSTHPLHTSASTQGRRHRAWCPPGFEVTRAEVGDKVALFNKAKELRHPLADVSVSLPVDLVPVLDKVSELRDGMPEWREKRCRQFESWAGRLQGDTARILDGRPSHVADAAGGAHVAMYMACIDALQWPHVSFAVEHCIKGFQVVGRVEDTGVWALRSEADMRRREAEFVPPALLRATNKAWATSLQHSIRRKWQRAALEPWGAEMAKIKAAWAASMKEVDVKGTAKGPFTVTEINQIFGWGNWRAAERFVVWQGDKYRPCDNMKKNLVNRSFLSSEHVVLPKPDAQSALGRAYYSRAVKAGWVRQCDVGGGSDDEADAYRHSASMHPELGVVAQAEPVSGSCRYFIPAGHNFGEEAAVQNYNSKPELHCAIARRLVGVAVEHYFDDFLFVEPEFCLGPCVVGAVGGRRYPASSQGCMWRVQACLGAQFALVKHVPWNRQNAFCGVVTDFRGLISEGVLRLRVKPTTLAKVRAMVDEARESRTLSGAQAASMRGKLLWTWMFVKVGRGELGPLAARQYGRDAEGAGTRGAGIGPQLARCLDVVSSFLRGRLPDVVMRAYDREAHAPVVVLSDAMFRPPDIGRGAYVVWVPARGGPGGWLGFADGAAKAAEVAAVRALREQKTLIMPLEAMAMGAPYFSPELQVAFAGCDVLHFADNKAANGAIVKAYSSAADLARIAGAMHVKWAELGVDPWIEFVASAANLSDEPSRCEYSWLVANGGVRLPWAFPPLAVWADGVVDD